MAKLHQKSSHLMSVKLGMVGALVGWGGGAEGRPGRLTDRVLSRFFGYQSRDFFGVLPGGLPILVKWASRVDGKLGKTDRLIRLEAP